MFALTSDEETQLFCIENVIKALKERNIRPRLTIIGEPTNCEIQTCANGCYEFKVEVFGKSCHSSRITEGINSINIISKLICFIEENQTKYKDLTSNCGIISGGEVVNKVPSFANLTFDVRSCDLKNVNLFLNDIQDKLSSLEKEYKGCKIALTKLLAIPPLQDLKNEFIYSAAKTLSIKIGQFSGGCEAGYYQAYSGDAFLFGVGNLSLAHKPNEYVVIEDYNSYSNLFKNLLKYMEIRL